MHIIAKNNPFIKKNGHITSNGFEEIFRQLPPSILARSARSLMLSLADTFAWNSDHKIWFSLDTIAQKGACSRSTARRNLDLAIRSGVLTRTEVRKENNAQSTNEYQLTPEFIGMARAICLELAKGIKSAALTAKLAPEFEKFMLSLRSGIKSGVRIVDVIMKKKAIRNGNLPDKGGCQNATEGGCQIDTQYLEVLFDAQKIKRSVASAPAAIRSGLKLFKEAKAERASTKAKDRAEVLGERQKKKAGLLKYFRGKPVVTPAFNSRRLTSEGELADQRFDEARNAHLAALAKGHGDAGKAAILKHFGRKCAAAVNS
ncbi:MAG TPA: hypothetical protein VGL07_16730 [Buttiauxella sp.]